MAEGIDVFGKYQTVTDWRKVRAAGKEFAYVKLSDGETDRDDYGYIHQGQNAGVFMGGYHYAQPGNGASQARRLIRRCRDTGGLDLAPACDLEDPFKPDSAAVAFANDFLEEIASEGYKKCLYGNNSMMSYLLPRVNTEGGVNWVARYASAPPTVSHDVWQYSQSGRVNGIVELCDLDSGQIPFNQTAVYPQGVTNMGFAVPLRPGKNQHVTIPAEGVPPFLYAHTSYGDKLRIRQIDYWRKTKPGTEEGDPVPNKGFHCGDDGLGNGGSPWEIKPNRPGELTDMTGWGVISVSVRYDNDTDQDLFMSVG